MKHIYLAIFLFPGYAIACSCAYDRSMEEVVNSSKTIFIGEVIGVERVGEIVPSGSDQEYEVTVHPIETIRGKPKKKYKFRGWSIYNSPHSDEVVVGGCGLDMELGNKIVVLYERGKKIYWDWCSEHVLLMGTRKYEYFMENFRNKF